MSEAMRILWNTQASIIDESDKAQNHGRYKRRQHDLGEYTAHFLDFLVQIVKTLVQVRASAISVCRCHCCKTASGSIP